MYFIKYFVLMSFIFKHVHAFEIFHKLSPICSQIPKFVHHRSLMESFSLNEYERDFLENKSHINMYPAGVKGYYNLGTVCFLKDNYNMNNYIICGASAGAWNSIAMAYKGSTFNFCTKMLKNVESNCNINYIYEMQLYLKSYLLNNYNMEDFDFSQTYISVCVQEPNSLPFTLHSHLYTDFKNLQDVADCCIASSNIPLITGPRNLYYDGYNSYDGGFNKKPFFSKEPLLKITPNMWENNCIPTSTFYDVQHLNIIKSFMMGYEDCNKTKINELFHT